MVKLDPPLAIFSVDLSTMRALILFLGASNLKPTGLISFVYGMQGRGKEDPFEGNFWLEIKTYQF